MKWYLVVITLILVIGLASAQKPFQLEKQQDVTVTCYDSLYGYCDPLTTCTITIFYPDGTTMLNEVPMSPHNTYFNYTIPQNTLSQTGTYEYSTECTLGDYNGLSTGTFEVNPQGKEYTSFTGLIYIGLIVVLIGLFLLGLYYSVSLPYENTRNEYNEIATINKKKYFKLFAMCMTYVMFVAIMYFAWNLSYGVLEFTEMANFFFNFFRVSYAFILPIFVITFIFGLVKYVKERKWEDMLKVGLTVK